MIRKSIGLKLILALTSICVSAMAYALPEGSGYSGFSSSGTFQVPAGVNAVRVVLIGGGGAGAGSHWRGGGSGNLASEILPVSPGASINIIVGAAGASAGCAGNSCNGGDGGASQFGGELMAAGGIGGASAVGSGNGGSGGGGAGNSGFGGSGGTGGANGSPGDDYAGGLGQGTDLWSDILSEVSYASMAAGNGGTPSNGSHQGGGGGGNTQGSWNLETNKAS